MRSHNSNSRDPSSEFERISLDDLSPRPGTPPRLQIQTPNLSTGVDNNAPPISPFLSPSRPIIIPRVSLRRTPTAGGLHWRRPSYSRVDTSTTQKSDIPSPSRQDYDFEGGVDPNIQEVQEGLNAALGTDAEIGTWLPTTRKPSVRRPDLIPTTPQIIVQETADDAFIPDEAETAGLTVNAGPI